MIAGSINSVTISNEYLSQNCSLNELNMNNIDNIVPIEKITSGK